jgi:hypothetical protein
MKTTQQSLLFRYRISLGIFVFGLVVSGITAFGLEIETALLNRVLGLNASTNPKSFLFPLQIFIYNVHLALNFTYARFPFLGYGTDWLGFGHLVIAAFFVLPFVDPIRYRAILSIGLLACAGVIVTALISGAIRHIPFFWTLIDCSFGVLGAIPLIYCLRITRRLLQCTDPRLRERF